MHPEEEGYLVGLARTRSLVERLAITTVKLTLHPFRLGSGLAQRIFLNSWRYMQATR